MLGGSDLDVLDQIFGGVVVLRAKRSFSQSEETRRKKNERRSGLEVGKLTHECPTTAISNPTTSRYVSKTPKSVSDPMLMFEKAETNRSQQRRRILFPLPVPPSTHIPLANTSAAKTVP